MRHNRSGMVYEGLILDRGKMFKLLILMMDYLDGIAGLK